MLRGGTEVSIYITYEVNKNSQRSIITGEKKNVVEINSYSTYGKEANDKTQTIGRIDKDSAPGDTTPYSSENIQDDAVSIGTINIKEYETNKRTINGIVWEDSRTNNLRTGQKVGNGIRDIGEIGINGVKVQLIETITQGGKTYEYIWQEMYTGETGYKYIGNGEMQAGTINNERGEYQFTNYIAGNYKIRFIYGQDIKTALTSKNSKSYNGQDFKSTAYHQGININEEWYNLSDSRINNTAYSDAKDNEQRRLQVINYSKTVTNPKAEVLTSHEINRLNASLHQELMNNTYMYADTAKINAKIEYDKTIGRGEETYTYNIRDIDLGLEQRPEANINIKNEIIGVKVTLSDGTVIVDIEEGVRKNVTIVPTIGNIQGKIHIYMDEEVMQGAEIEIKYKITITNESEIDTYGNSTSVGRTYYTGQASSDQIVTTQIGKIIDYVDNSLVFKKENNPDWELIEQTGLQNTASMKTNGYLNSKTNTTQTINQTKAETTQVIVNESLKNIKLRPGEKAETYLTLSKVISPNDEADDLSYNNMAEIIEITNDVGRRNLSKVVGNQNTEGMPNETDAANTQTVIITPPTGKNKEITSTILIAIGSLITICSITLGIREKMKKKL